MVNLPPDYPHPSPIHRLLPTPIQPVLLDIMEDHTQHDRLTRGDVIRRQDHLFPFRAALEGPIVAVAVHPGLPPTPELLDLDRQAHASEGHGRVTVEALLDGASVEDSHDMIAAALAVAPGDIPVAEPEIKLPFGRMIG